MIADQGLFCVDAVLLVGDLVAELHTVELVGLRARGRLALREGERKPTRGLVPLAVQRHRDAAAICCPLSQEIRIADACASQVLVIIGPGAFITTTTFLPMAAYFLIKATSFAKS